MPSKYDPSSALPLRVPPDVRKSLDALVDQVPPALRLPRNSVAVAALVRGLEQLGAELPRDPMAVHRALAGERAPSPSTGSSSRAPAARPVEARRPTRASAERAPAPVEGGDAGAPPPDSAELLKRWKRAKLPLITFCRENNIPRSVMQAWRAGRPAKPATLARIAAGLDAAGK